MIPLISSSESPPPFTEETLTLPDNSGTRVTDVAKRTLPHLAEVSTYLPLPWEVINIIGGYDFGILMMDSHRILLQFANQFPSEPITNRIKEVLSAYQGALKAYQEDPHEHRLILETTHRGMQDILLDIFDEICINFSQLSLRQAEEALDDLPENSTHRTRVETWLYPRLPKYTLSDGYQLMPDPGQIPDPMLYMSLYYVLADRKIQEIFDQNFLRFFHKLADNIEELMPCLMTEKERLEPVTKQATLVRERFKSFTQSSAWKKSARIDLSKAGLTLLTGAILSYLNCIDDLQHLDLTDNNLRLLPDAIRSLTNLRVFHLGGNKLTTLTEAIGDLKKLRWLFLNNNELRMIPRTIFELSLTVLNLTGNRFRAIPQGIQTCRQAHLRVSLAHNPLLPQIREPLDTTVTIIL